MIRIVIASSYGDRNLGDQAIAEAMISHLKENIDCDIVFLSFDPLRSGRDLKVRAVRSTFFRGIGETFREMREADVVIIGGGGLIQDQSSFFNLLFHLSRIYLARIARVKIMGYALGVGPLTMKLSRKIATYLLDKIDLITLRDEESLHLLQAMGVRKPVIRVTADPVINYPEINGGRQRVVKMFSILKKKKIIIGVNLRKIFHYRRFIPAFLTLRKDFLNSSRGLKELQNLLQAIAGVLNRICDQYGAALVFFSMLDEIDGNISKEMANYIDEKNIMKDVQSPDTVPEMFRLIDTFDLVIGMRLHALIMAFKMKKPIVAVSYSSKVDAFMNSIDAGAYVNDAYNFNQDVFFTQVSQVIANRKKISAWNAQEYIRKSELERTNIMMLKGLLGE
ncbi:MAG: polysaccharide pyruvyl transferase family protein [Candidatus Cloacimonetes bacterium]|nr:polysaccharide pyruvyl transferase family protein [Candidatus Cloacimonadota bacterium]